MLLGSRVISFTQFEDHLANWQMRLTLARIMLKMLTCMLLNIIDVIGTATPGPFTFFNTPGPATASGMPMRIHAHGVATC